MFTIRTIVYNFLFRKLWSLFSAEVNITNGFESLAPENLEDMASSTFASSELIIPARSLSYGTYKLVFTSRMWDDSIADPNWTRKLPFSNNVFTYIKIKKSPLKGMMIQGGVSMITRGRGQSLELEPYLYAEDPDYPEDQVSIFGIHDIIS